VRVVLTLLVRDEADIVDAHLAFHFAAGVDFVIATDHRSADGTSEILDRYAREGVLRVIREESQVARQAEWQTRMARLAATEHRADWVIPSDADEFWWPRAGSIPEALESVPAEYGIVRALTRNFVPPYDDEGWFGDRMTLRLATPAPINDPGTPFRPVVKVAHRGDPRVVVAGGGHQVFGLAWPLFTDWHPFEVLHFPLRSRDQYARKYEKTWTGWPENLRGDLARAREVAEQGRPEAMWGRVALDEPAIRQGLAAGSLVRDTRLRDALGPHLGEASPETLPRELPTPALEEQALHAVEVAVFDEAQVVRAQRWVDELSARVRRLEGSRGDAVRPA
jgi:Glycosyl transferase family 2